MCSGAAESAGAGEASAGNSVHSAQQAPTKAAGELREESRRRARAKAGRKMRSSAGPRRAASEADQLEELVRAGGLAQRLGSMAECTSEPFLSPALTASDRYLMRQEAGNEARPGTLPPAVRSARAAAMASVEAARAQQDSDARHLKTITASMTELERAGLPVLPEHVDARTLASLAVAGARATWSRLRSMARQGHVATSEAWHAVLSASWEEPARDWLVGACVVMGKGASLAEPRLRAAAMAGRWAAVESELAAHPALLLSPRLHCAAAHLAVHGRSLPLLRRCLAAVAGSTDAAAWADAGPLLQHVHSVGWAEGEEACCTTLLGASRMHRVPESVVCACERVAAKGHLPLASLLLTRVVNEEEEARPAVFGAALRVCAALECPVEALQLLVAAEPRGVTLEEDAGTMDALAVVTGAAGDSALAEHIREAVAKVSRAPARARVDQGAVHAFLRAGDPSRAERTVSSLLRDAAVAPPTMPSPPGLEGTTEAVVNGLIEAGRLSNAASVLTLAGLAGVEGPSLADAGALLSWRMLQRRPKRASGDKGADAVPPPPLPLQPSDEAAALRHAWRVGDAASAAELVARVQDPWRALLSPKRAEWRRELQSRSGAALAVLASALVHPPPGRSIALEAAEAVASCAVESETGETAQSMGGGSGASLITHAQLGRLRSSLTDASLSVVATILLAALRGDATAMRRAVQYAVREGEGGHGASADRRIRQAMLPWAMRCVHGGEDVALSLRQAMIATRWETAPQLQGLTAGFASAYGASPQRSAKPGVLVHAYGCAHDVWTVLGEARKAADVVARARADAEASGDAALRRWVASVE